MPPRSAIASLLCEPGIFRQPYICPSCQLKPLKPSPLPLRHYVGSQSRPPPVTRPGNPIPPDRKRYARPTVTKRCITTTPAITAINAQRDIPEPNKPLHAALARLEQDAGLFVDISQLRLALKGLESKDAITRVAILGLEGTIGARRLARVLLADPLGEEAEWEKVLLDFGDSDGRALLLRYGKHMSIDDRHPLVKTIFIPSHVLKTHQLEVFIQSVGAQEAASEEEAAGLLVPGLETAAASSSGQRMSTITYPVHKSLVCADGLKYVALFAQLAGHTNVEEQESIIKGTIDGSWSTLSTGKAPHAVNAINISLAEEAIGLMRKSASQSFTYEHAWFDSGLPTVSDWFTSGTTTTTTIKPTVTRLIHAITARTTSSIAQEEARAQQEAKAATVPQNDRNVLGRAITTWAEHSHYELQNRLDVAFTSKSWKRLKWYKLPFRCDDVPSTLSTLLTKGWLPDSERVLIYLSGRLIEAGLLPEPRPAFIPYSQPDQEDAHATIAQEQEGDDLKPLGAMKKDLTIRDINLQELKPKAFDTQGGEILLTEPPYNVLITSARAQMYKDAIPRLHALAQSLSLQALSTTAISTTISTFLYVSISATSVYEASAVAAVGTIWALRRLQQRWESARTEWMEELMEEGRKVLKYTEDEYLRAVKEEGYKDADERGEQERAKARFAVESVRVELERLERGGERS